MSISISIDPDHSQLPYGQSRVHSYGDGNVASWIDVGAVPGGRDFTLVSNNATWLRNYAALLLDTADALDKATDAQATTPQNDNLPSRDLRGFAHGLH